MGHLRLSSQVAELDPVLGQGCKRWAPDVVGHGCLASLGFGNGRWIHDFYWLVTSVSEESGLSESFRTVFWTFSGSFPKVLGIFGNPPPCRLDHRAQMSVTPGQLDSGGRHREIEWLLVVNIPLGFQHVSILTILLMVDSFHSWILNLRF